MSSPSRKPEDSDKPKRPRPVSHASSDSRSSNPREPKRPHPLREVFSRRDVPERTSQSEQRPNQASEHSQRNERRIWEEAGASKKATGYTQQDAGRAQQSAKASQQDTGRVLQSATAFKQILKASQQSSKSTQQSSNASLKSPKSSQQTSTFPKQHVERAKFSSKVEELFGPDESEAFDDYITEFQNETGLFSLYHQDECRHEREKMLELEVREMHSRLNDQNRVEAETPEELVEQLNYDKELFTDIMKAKVKILGLRVVEREIKAQNPGSALPPMPPSMEGH